MKGKNNSNEFTYYSSECTEFARLYPEEIIGVFGDNVNEEQSRGRKDRETEEPTKFRSFNER